MLRAGRPASAAPRRRRVAGSAGAIRHLAGRGRVRAAAREPTFVGRVFLEGATITRGGGASSVARRRAGAAASAAARAPRSSSLGRARAPRRDAGRRRRASRRARSARPREARPRRREHLVGCGRTRARALQSPPDARAFSSRRTNVRAFFPPPRFLARVVSGARAYRDAPPSEHARPRRRRRGARGDALARLARSAATRADVMLLATALLRRREPRRRRPRRSRVQLFL